MLFNRIIFFFLLFYYPIAAYCQKPAANVLQHPQTVSDYDKLISFYRYYKPDSAMYYAQLGVDLAKHNKDDNGLALMYNQLGMINDNLGKFDESRELYLTAHDIYARTGFQKGIATELIRLGVVELRKGNYDKAIGYFLESLNVSEQSGNKAGQMEANVTLAEGYMGQHKYDVALRYLVKAEKISATIPFSNISLNLYNDYGILYRDTGDFDKAKAYFNKGISLSNKPQYQGLFISLTNNLASVYAMQGFRQKSIQLQKTALAKAREIKNYLREELTLTGLAETYGKDDPAEALFYFKQALDLVKQKGAQKQVIEILDRIADMYQLQGKYKEAYLAKQEEHAIAEKYFYQGMAKQIVSLQNKYDLDKSVAKVKELEYINGKESLEHKVILTIMGGVVILLIFFALFYFRTSKLNWLLNKTNTELQESNTVKDKLFSVLAHDLRSPLATIINLLYVISDDDLPAEERKELINMVTVTSSASLDTLNNLLKWGEMQIKGIRLAAANLQAREIVTQDIDLLNASAQLKGITVKNDIDEQIQVYADRDHFEFVVRNLLSNAIKFTGEGGLISISAVPHEARNEVQFTVKDNGVGIDADRIVSIFNIGNISTDGTRDEKGTSIGLVLCKEFIEANQGKIWVKSKLGEGSEFEFTLRAAKN
ncbi:tetratricopeptide repeat protein [Mucilaginibacter sp. AW1-3]